MPILLFAVIVSPWFILIELRYPGALDLLIIREHFARFSSGIHHHSEPCYFLSLITLAGLLPWTGWFVRRWQGVFEDKSDSDVFKFLLCWGLAILAFFSISSSQLISYLTPVIPVFCGVLGLLLSKLKKDDFRAGIIPACSCFIIAAGMISYVLWYEIDNSWAVSIPAFFTLVASFVALKKMSVLKSVTLTAFFFAVGMFSFAYVAAPLFNKTRSIEEVAAYIQNNFPANVPIATYSIELPGLGLLLHKRIIKIGSIGEIESGLKWVDEADKSKWFPSIIQFQRLVSKSKDNDVVVLEKKKLKEFNEQYSNWDIVATLGRFIILSERQE